MICTDPFHGIEIWLFVGIRFSSHPRSLDLESLDLVREVDSIAQEPVLDDEDDKEMNEHPPSRSYESFGYSKKPALTTHDNSSLYQGLA